MNTQKLKVTADQLNNIPITVSSAQISEHCVYCGSLRKAAGFHSSSMTLNISQYSHISTVHIGVLQQNTTENFTITKEYVYNTSVNATKIIIVDNTSNNTYDLYVTGSYYQYYTKGSIFIIKDPTVSDVRPIGEIVNVSDLTIYKEYLIKDLEYYAMVRTEAVN